MPFFSEETLESVRSIPLYEVVRPTVELSRSGKNWRGLSPFSNEKTPSFYVLTDLNLFKCHSTGLAGDGIRFLQETEKLTFPEAVETLAERFAIPVRYASGGGPDPETRSLKQAVLDIHEYARDYFHQTFLADHPVSDQVRRYWVEERGFSMDLAREFHIGLAPPKSRRLLELLREKGFSHEALKESGLFNPGRHPSDPDSWFFLFRGRLMIPIRDLQGQVVAFTARQLDLTPRDHASWKAKYINSPETLVFHKSRLLFNLDRAREAVRESGRILLVEGQLDALRCWDAGLKEAVAPQGTSVTEEQLSLIKRYTDRLDVLMDSDAAGARAVLRLLPMAFKAGLEVHVICLPPGSDPDDFLRAHGVDGLTELRMDSGIHFAGRTLLGEGEPSPEQRSKVLEQLFEILAACPSAVVREGYFEEAVRVTGVSSAAARQDAARFSRGRRPENRASQREISGKPGTKTPETLTNLEGDLIWAVSQNVQWVELLAQVIDQQWIHLHTIEGRVLSHILAQATVDHLEGFHDILNSLETDEERDCLHRYRVQDREKLDVESFLNVTIASLARRFCKERVNSLDKEIAKFAHADSDASKLRQLVKERRELKQFLLSGPFPELPAGGPRK
ncbi:MAG: DNA primase [Oceanipulchritudo sp.]